MEEHDQNSAETRLPALVADGDHAVLEIIRTETVLSRLPIHNLAKKGSINISILKKTETGEIELLWKVSPSRDYGEPRQLAYKLDTIVINQRIDEAGRPLPKLLRLGSLNEICAELGLAVDHGTNAKNLRNAFLQNALTGITAKFGYHGKDGTERRLEAAFTRYSVIFTGEKLPDGRKANAVYIVFNEPFWEVLNNAPVRPLDRAYMKALPPAAQRFYEIISRKIFAALKNHYPSAKIAYSQYCTFSAQLRHYERQRVQDQMAKVLRHHKESGYIAGVRYDPTFDGENRSDWIIYLTPGPKAYAEFAAAHRKRQALNAAAPDAEDTGAVEPRSQRDAMRRRSTQRQSLVAPAQVFDSQLVAEFTRRGITKEKAVQLLANLKPGQDPVAQLELGDHLVKNARVPITNPPGFLIRLVSSNTSVPDGFETAARRKAREDRERQERERRAAEDARQQLEWDYDDYCQREADRYIEENPAEFEEVRASKEVETRQRHPSLPADFVASIAMNEAKREIRKRVPPMSFEQFASRREQGSDLDLHAVPAPAVETAPAGDSPKETREPDIEETPSSMA